MKLEESDKEQKQLVLLNTKNGMTSSTVVKMRLCLICKIIYVATNTLEMGEGVVMYRVENRITMRCQYKKDK